ncbi:MAG: TRAP transporter large permease [Eubacterium sp.]
MIPAMVKEGYDKSFSCSLASAAGSLGTVIPPSVIFVMYGVTVGASISDLFIAGITPGILIGVVLIIYSKILVKKNHWGIVQPKITAKEKLKAVKDAIWAILVPVIILGGIYSGIFTPTEAAVVACVYAIIIGFFVYKELTIKKLYQVFKRSTLTLGSAIIIVAFSSIFGRILTIQQVPQSIAGFLGGITDSKILILILINVFLFFVGMFMETLSAVLILAPILVPVAVTFGISPIHFGVIMTINLAMGLCTPPVGVNSYIASSIGGIKIEQMVKTLIPVIVVMFVTILAISFIEPTSMWLVNLLN